MSFLDEDVVALKKDPAIIGSIYRTWNDVDQERVALLRDFYHDKNMPSQFKTALGRHGRLLRGFVIVELLNARDGYCLVSEDALRLVDRNFVVGDVVKQKSSDFQSGTVISTSVRCTLKSPFSSPVAYGTAAVEETSDPSHVNQRNDPSHQVQQTNIAASELKNFAEFREEDFIIYKDWIGQIVDLREEITLRLSNGSIVEVAEPDVLDEYCYFNGSDSLELVERLAAIGFTPTKSRGSKISKKHVEACRCWHPGQRVRTTKSILRQGRWKVGAFSPQIKPFGTILDVRVVELDVDWIFPNIYKNRTSQKAPSTPLALDDALRQDIIKYDRSRRPEQEVTMQLPHAVHSPDFRLGDFVRFRAPTKGKPDFNDQSAQMSPSNLVSEAAAATQSSKTSVLQVAQTLTRVLVQWQDATISEDAAVCLTSYQNPDEHESWPMEKVSLACQEERFLSEDSIELNRTSKIGVVLSVDSKERMAHVKWYKDPLIEFPSCRPEQATTLRYGTIGGDSRVSLYEITDHIGPDYGRGNMVFIIPEVPGLSAFDLQPLWRQNAIKSGTGGDSQTPWLRPMQILDDTRDYHGSGQNSKNGTGHSSEVYLRTLSTENVDDRYREKSSLPTTFNDIKQSISSQEQRNESSSESVPGLYVINHCEKLDTTYCFGEILDLCSDGEVIVRLGAFAVCQDVKVQPERLIVIASGDSGEMTEDSEDEEVASDSIDSLSTSIEASAPQTTIGQVNVAVEHEHTDLLDEGSDEEEWETDDEETLDTVAYTLQNAERGGFPDTATASNLGPKSAVISDSYEPIFSSKYPLIPDSFSILESSPPDDHAYPIDDAALDRKQMRRIIDEHKILASSLPEGVFARSWEQRLDLLRILFVGPTGTPYEYAPFLVDMSLRPPFPAQPPKVHFHSWTNNMGRINPNLYEDGNICLSLLGTWHTEGDNEGWSSTKSTILQIIVSILGLVLVKEPYYNEAGYEILVNMPDTVTSSSLYNEKAYVLSKGFVKKAIMTMPGGFEDVLRWLYIAKDGPKLLGRIIDDCKGLCETSEMDTYGTDRGGKVMYEGAWRNHRVSAGALVLLRRNMDGLIQIAKDNDL